MLSILSVILPVFLIVGAGWSIVRVGILDASVIDGLMAYTIRFALPVLLFRALAHLDLTQAFDLKMQVSFYAGAFACYAIAILLARFVWKRRPGEAAVIGFCALFSNTLLLGLPVLDRAYGAETMPLALSIVTFHAPILYMVGITVMEILRSDGAGPVATAKRAAKAMFSNALTIGIAAGFFWNISTLQLPEFIDTAMEMISDSALPASLFGLGGALTRYTLRDDIGTGLMAAVLTTVLQPAVTFWLTVHVFALPEAMVRASVVIAAMPAGMNGYLFAQMYNRAQGAAASAVLIGTALSVLTISVWLWVLGGAQP